MSRSFLLYLDFLRTFLCESSSMQGHGYFMISNALRSDVHTFWTNGLRVCQLMFNLKKNKNTLLYMYLSDYGQI